MIGQRLGASAVTVLVALLALSSCGANPQAGSPPEEAKPAPAATSAAAPEESAPLADWPPLTEREDSPLAAGLVSQVLNKMPPSLTVSDALIQPGETAQVAIGLGRGLGSTTIKTYPGRTVVVTDADGKEVLREKTGDKGTLAFERAFEKPGNYFFRAAVDGQVDDKDVAPVLFGVYVRPSDAPVAICDLDKTLVSSGFGHVVAGVAKPFDHSSDVAWRLVRERRMTVIYLTHRPDLFGPSSKLWLRKSSFPPGPLYTSDIAGLLEGSGKFKTAEIARLKKRFPNLQLAVGDKYSDVAAYVENNIRSILIPDIDWGKSKAEYWQDRLRDMTGVKADVDVCRNWFEIEDVIFADKTYPPGRMIDRIKEMIRQAPKPVEDD